MILIAIRHLLLGPFCHHNIPVLPFEQFPQTELGQQVLPSLAIPVELTKIAFQYPFPDFSDQNYALNTDCFHFIGEQPKQRLRFNKIFIGRLRDSDRERCVVGASQKILSTEFSASRKIVNIASCHATSGLARDFVKNMKTRIFKIQR